MKKVYRKRIEQIIVGEVVAGATGRWYRIVKVDVDRKSRTVVLHGRDVNVNSQGWLRGALGDVRDCLG